MSKRRALRDTADYALDLRCGDLRLGEPHDIPAGKEGFQVFLGVGDEPGGARLLCDFIWPNLAVPSALESLLSIKSVFGERWRVVSPRLGLQEENLRRHARKKQHADVNPRGGEYATVSR